MRITLLTLGSRGDIQPYIPLALGLQASGHDVKVATHVPYEDFVRGCGLDYAPISGDPMAMMSEGSGLAWVESGRNPLKFMKEFRSFTNSIMRDLWVEAYAATEDADAILFSLLGVFAAAHLAEKFEIPAAGVYLQPVHPSDHYAMMMLPELPASVPGRGLYNRLSHHLWFDSSYWLFKGVTNELRQEMLGLPRQPISFYQQMQRPYPVIYGFSRHVFPRPTDWNPAAKISGYWFMDDAEWTPSEALLDFLDAGPKPVYVGFGSMTNRDAEAQTGIVLDAIRQSGQRAILLSGWAGIGQGDLPDSVFKLDYAPHSWLFPRMAAVVHHGGAGTSAAGFRAGVPSVLVPHFADQPFWGRRVRALGVGPDFIPQKQLSAEELAQAIQVAVSDSAMKQRAAALGEQVRAEDGVATAVGWINEIVEQPFSAFAAL